MPWPQTGLGCGPKERDFWHIHQTKVMMKIHDHDHDHNGVHDLSLRAILLALTLGWSIYLCFLIGKWVASFSSKSPPTIWYLCTNYLGTSGTSFLWISKVLWENQRIWILSIFEYLLKLLIRIYLDICFFQKMYMSIFEYLLKLFIQIYLDIRLYPTLIFAKFCSDVDSTQFLPTDIIPRPVRSGAGSLNL